MKKPKIILFLFILVLLVLVGLTMDYLTKRYADIKWQEHCRICRADLANQYCFSCCDQKDLRGVYRICP